MLKNRLGYLYSVLVAGKQKALAGAVVVFLVTFEEQHLGHHVSNGLQQFAISGVAAVLTHLTVYFKANKN